MPNMLHLKRRYSYMEFAFYVNDDGNNLSEMIYYHALRLNMAF